MGNSLITSLRDGQRVHKGQVVEIGGGAWDGGRGIRDVEVSMDGGSSWYLAFLGKDYGRFSFRTFSHKFKASQAGALVVMARAYNMRGDTQVEKLILNPAGYHHNVVQRVRLEVV